MNMEPREESRLEMQMGDISLLVLSMLWDYMGSSRDSGKGSQENCSLGKSNVSKEVERKPGGVTEPREKSGLNKD